MKKCIICEKPSLAANVCKALAMMGEKVTRKDGYSESNNFYVVPAFGHLFGLYDIEEYSGKEASKWSLEQLPFFPRQYQFALKKDSKTKKVDSGVKKQFLLIKKLIQDKQTEAVIHCGDSDREGEIIVRIILDEAGNKKPVYRLWLPDQVEKTIINALSSMELDSIYDNLAREGYARTFIDWNYGINLTRYATLKSNTLLKVGRVVSAIVKTIYDRDKEIENFIPEKYLAIISKAVTNGEEIELTSKQQFKPYEIQSAREMCQEFNSMGAVVTDIKTERKVVGSPKLFSQSGLQNVLSKRFKYSPDKTLSLVQALYERGYVSYPRTPTEYLATAEKGKVKSILEAIQAKGRKVVFKDKKSIFDDSKIESHSAITPTIKIPTEHDFKSVDEKNCYETIYNRFCAVFYEEDCVIDQTIMTISIGDKEQFTLKGNVSISKGWKKIEPSNETEKTLPKLNQNDKVIIDFKPVEKQTQPKKHYTVETLNNYLKNPYKEESKQADENDEDDYKALFDGLEIGTEATRPSIIAGAIKSEYIALEKTNYVILPKGKYYVECLDKLGIDMSKEKTVFLGKALKDVYKGNMTIEESLSVVNAEISRIVNSQVQIEQMANDHQKDSIGKCPRCGKKVISYQKAYACESGKEGCGFVIFRTIAQKEITNAQAQKLLTKGKTDLIKGFTAKSGKKFEAYLTMTPDKTVEFQFK
jgi:DNA topoisomerase-3